MLKMIGSGKRVLEFGCASGYMSKMMVAAGCRVTAIEVDPGAASLARANCEEVLVADLDVRPLVDLLPATPYDVAVFGDVLEHLRDPWRVLDDTRKFLGPAGFAVISIPNVAHGAVRLSLLEGRFDYSGVGLLDDTHLRFFTLRSVRELCMRSGYRITEIARTKVPIFHPTEVLPYIREDRFDPALVQKIQRDPEHDTLQFILRATPLADAERFSVLVSDFFAMESRLGEASEREAASSEQIAKQAMLRDQLEQARIAAENEQAALRAALDELRITFESTRATAEAELASFRGEINSERAAREAVEQQFAHGSRAFDVERETFKMSLAELQASLDEAIAKPAFPIERQHRLEQLETENVQLRTDVDRLRATYRDVLERFVTFLDRELAVTRSRTVEVDAAMRAIQSSKFWTVKKAVARIVRLGR